MPSPPLGFPDLPKSWHSWFHITPKSVAYVQDVVHIAVKLKSRLLKPSIILPMGMYTATPRHLHSLQTTFSKDQHGLRDKDISHKDRQNFDAVLHIVNASHLLDKIKDASATKIYIELIGCIVDSFLDKSLDPVVRIEKVWYAVFFLRYWCEWILLHPSYTLKQNFVTSNAYMCVELCAHALITYLITMRDHFPSVHHGCFAPWLLGSQTCEKTFRAVRSMSTMFSTVINFGMLGLLRRLHHLHVQFTLQSETGAGIIFPNILKHQVKEGKNLKMNYCLTELTNTKILAAVAKTESDVKRAMEKLGMDKLLRKYNAWDSLKEITCVKSGDSDSDDDDDNDENDDDHPNEDDRSCVLSSVIQEVCDDEPIQIATDTKNIINNKLVEKQVREKLEDQHALLSFKRLPSTTIPMYKSVKVDEKSSKNRKAFSPFVEIKNNNKTFFIRKTTAVWLLQESERVSSDRLFRVRQKQPFASNQNSKFKGKTPLSLLISEPITEKVSSQTEKVSVCDTVATENEETTDSKQIINVDDIPDVPSQAWVKLNGITFYFTDKADLLSNTSWLNGSHMTAVQLLLKHQFPKIRSLEDTLKQQIAPLKSIPPGSLQIL